MRNFLMALGLLVLGSSSVFAKDTRDQVSVVQDVVIVAANCGTSGSSQIVMTENKDRVARKIDDKLCAEFKSEYSSVLNCTAVKADLALKYEPQLLGYFGAYRVIDIKNAQGVRGLCL